MPRVVVQAQPADVGVVGVEDRTGRAAEDMPERLLRRLRLEIPERHVDRRKGELGDAGAADPLQGGVAGELEPEPRML